MTDHAMLYVWWNDHHQEPWRDLANPIIPSIATFRAVNHQTPVLVADCSDTPHQWGRFPLRLDFEVVRPECRLPPAGDIQVSPDVRKLCGRLEVVRDLARKIPQAKVMVCDADIFWLRNPIPFLPPITHFHGNQHNNGFFCFHQDSGEALHVMDTWGFHTAKALADLEHRAEIVSQYYVPYFNDEAVYCYVKKLEPELIRELGVYWNYLDYQEADWVQVLENSRNYHFCSKVWGAERGVYALVIEEFHRRLEMVLNREEIASIFGEGRMAQAKTFTITQMRKARLHYTTKPKVFG